MNREDDIRGVFETQKQRYRQAPFTPYETRLDRLRRLEALVRENHREIMAATQSDFGTRDPDAAFLGDICSPLMHGAHVQKHLKGWMKPQRRSDGFLGLLGQRSVLHHEPLGVVGIISPFNAPFTLAFDPAIDAIAAGNRVMLRFPEATPNLGALVESLVAKYFEQDELAVVTGDIQIAKLFASLPWDKLVFTGGCTTARHIMAAAAQNLTPVLLELGGKSPVVVLEDADVEEVAKKTARIRLMNGGQVCIAGDYALVPQAHRDAFVRAAIAEAETAYPTIIDNPRFTALIDDRAFDRLQGYVDEAKAAGAMVITANAAGEAVPCRKTRKFPFTVVLDPPEHCRVSQEEIFGPILAVHSYNHLDDAIGHINRRSKPLALYVFGKDRRAIDTVLRNTSSGGVTVNDLLLHAGSHEMGFGGVGESGMGRYKGGRVGFEAFSNAKAVVHQGFLSRYSRQFMLPFLQPRPRNMIASQIGLDPKTLHPSTPPKALPAGEAKR